MRSLFNGLAQLVIQATKVPGAIDVEAYAEEFPGPKLPVTRLSITTRKARPRPAAPWCSGDAASAATSGESARHRC
jgi:beta-galactosidase